MKRKRSTEEQSDSRRTIKRWINPDHLDSSEDSKYGDDATPLLREQGKTPKS